MEEEIDNMSPQQYVARKNLEEAMKKAQAEDLENLLENIRINSINLSNYHRYRFFHWLVAKKKKECLQLLVLLLIGSV